MGGPARRGHSILGLAGVDDDGLPYTTLSYANGPGAATSRERLTEEAATDPDFIQPALAPVSSETHTGEDVAILATGPYAHLFHGVQEQSFIYRVIRTALSGG